MLGGKEKSVPLVARPYKNAEFALFRHFFRLLLGDFAKIIFRTLAT
jgi:hypothetical protein